MAEISDEFLAKIAAGVEVAKTQSTELNRRTGQLEADIRQIIATLMPQVTSLEMRVADLETPPSWLDYAKPALVWVAVISISAFVGQQLGVNVQW